MADPLSIAAGIAGLLAFAGTTLTKGYTIVQSLQGSGKEVQQLLTELTQLTGLLCALEAQENIAKRSFLRAMPRTSNTDISKVLDSSTNDCHKTIKRVSETLEKLEKSRKATLALKWQFLEPEVKKMVQEIGRYNQIFILCLGVDTRKRTDDMLDLQTEISLKLLDMQDEREKEKIAAHEERTCLERQALFRWLVPKSDEKHAKATKLRAPGTGKWLLEHPEFICWTQGQDSLLWLNGIPGCGKTVLMSQVIGNLLQSPSVSNKTAGVAFFYFTYEEAEGTSVPQLLSSLAAQILRHIPCPEAGPAMRSFRECDDGTSTPALDKMQDLLINLIQQLETVYICLDALDECGAENKIDVLAFIFVLLEKCSNVKLLVSSRTNDTDVSEYFEGCPSITVTAGALAEDIDVYVRHRINNGPVRLKRAQSEAMIKTLVRGAEGMFLWASCQIDQLSRLNTRAGVESALISLPRGLHETYRRILLNIPPEDEFLATRIFKWLAHAVAPLTLPQLVEAIAIEDHNATLESLQVQRLIVPEDVYHICGSLVRYSESTGMLGLAHHSVYEFLTSPATSGRVPRSYFIPGGQSTIDLTTTCLTYLSFKDFELSFTQSFMGLGLESTAIVGHQVTEGLIEHPFYDYAVRNWFHHLPSFQEGIDQLWPRLVEYFDQNTGGFESSVTVLRHLEGPYKYPLSMKPIHFCATHGLSMVLNRILNDTNIDVECGVEDGRRAIHMATENGHEEVVQELLLCQKVNVNKRTLDGRTPVQLAMESGNEAITKLLIQAGAEVNANLAHGDTALSLAVVNRWHSLAKFLIDNQADPNGLLYDGRSPFHVAAAVGSDKTMLRLLSDAGANPFQKDEDGLTPLHLAAYYGRAETAAFLLQVPGVRRLFNTAGWTPLHCAVQEEHCEVIEEFKEYGYIVSKSLTDLRSSLGSDGDSGQFKPPKHWKELKSGKSDELFDPHDGTLSAGAYSKEPAQPGVSRVIRSVPTPLWLATCQEFDEGILALLRARVTKADKDNCMKYARDKNMSGIWELLRRGPSFDEGSPYELF